MEFRNEFFFLSNFFPCVIENIDGVKFPTVENAYQWCKEVDPSREFTPVDRGTTVYNWTKYMTEASPFQAKRVGRRANMKPNWDSIRVEVMRRLLKQKFQVGTELAKRLRATRNMKLEEGNWWHDNFWGICMCNRCRFRGQNMLGKLLMERREELRKAGD